MIVCSQHVSLFPMSQFFQSVAGEINARGLLICHLMVDDKMFTCEGKIGHEGEKNHTKLNSFNLEVRQHHV